MIVYTFDYVTGAYTGTQQLTIGDCDPRAPGVMLVPGNATTIEPPRCGKGLWPYWNEGRWHVVELITEPDPLAADYYANM
jgi:hypothetical protein